MSEPNATYRFNRSGMEDCCLASLQLELYRRKGTGEELMRDGDTLRCKRCNAEMVCDPSGRDGRLRWRWNGSVESKVES